MVNPYDITTTSIPKPVKAARVLLFVTAGVSVLTGLFAYMVLAEENGAMYAVGAAIGVFGVIAAVNLALGLRIDKGRKPLWIGIIVVQVVMIFYQLGRLGQGDPMGLIAAALPIAILILVCRKPARTYFARPAGGSANQILS